MTSACAFTVAGWTCAHATRPQRELWTELHRRGSHAPPPGFYRRRGQIAPGRGKGKAYVVYAFSSVLAATHAGLLRSWQATKHQAEWRGVTELPDT
jgi:hypothetical protein